MLTITPRRVAVFWSNVDTTGDCWLWTGPLSKGGYARFKAGGKTYMAHRLAYELLDGPIPEDSVLDHKCHVRHCVFPLHLRPVTQKQNMENRRGLDSNNTSGYRGVSWCKRRHRWFAQVVHFGKKYHVGYFDTAEQAGLAAQSKRTELFTHETVDTYTKV